MDEGSDDIVLTMYQASWFGSATSLGAAGGSLLSSFLMMFLGQRICLLIVLPIGLVSWVTMAITRSLWVLILSRIFQGVVMGISSGCTVTYISELSDKSIRGRLSAPIDVMRQTGFLLIFIMGSSSLSWRTVAIIAGVSTTVLPFIGFIFLHDSPRWLASRGRISEAAKSLQFFKGGNYNCDSELNEITKQTSEINEGKKNRDSLAMFLNKSILTRMFILTVQMICFHFTGNFVILTYSVLIFQTANVSINPYLSTIVISVLRVMGTIIYLLLVDKIGRKPLLTVPMFLAGTCMGMFGLFFYLKTTWNDMSSIAWLPLVSMLFFSLFICIATPVIMLCRNELLPTPVRAAGIGFLNFVFNSSSFVVALTYPGMVKSLGSHWIFFIFAIVCFLMGTISALFIPETKKLSLEKTGDVQSKTDQP